MVIDKNIFDQSDLLERLGGDEEFLWEIIKAFLSDMPKQFKNLKASIDDWDIQTVERIAHTIKGSSINVGASSLSKAAFRLEFAAKKQNSELVNKSYQFLESEYKILENLILSITK